MSLVLSINLKHFLIFEQRNHLFNHKRPFLLLYMPFFKPQNPNFVAFNVKTLLPLTKKEIFMPALAVAHYAGRGKIWGPKCFQNSATAAAKNSRFRTLLDAKNLLRFLYAHILKFYNQRRTLKRSHQRHRAPWLPFLPCLPHCHATRRWCCGCGWWWYWWWNWQVWMSTRSLP